MTALQIRKAVRRSLPLQVAFYGPSGSGKTLSGILFASGLVGDGKVAVIDSERGRASLYADNKKVLAALPGGFDVIELDQPYHPHRYIEAMDIVERGGYKACLIDSGSDSWDGPGGCSDIAETSAKKWVPAKLANKRMMTRAALSDMHIIWCLKAQEKTKVVDKAKSGTGKQEYIDLGVLPIWEKNNFYPMLLAFSVDPKSHLSTVVKCHDDLWGFFPEPKLITKEDGVRIRKWNESGVALGDYEQLQKRARVAAEEGVEAYKAFFGAITADQRKALAGEHASNKKVAEDADRGRANEAADVADTTSVPIVGTAADPVQWPDGFDGEEIIWNGKHLRVNGSGNYSPVKDGE